MANSTQQTASANRQGIVTLEATQPVYTTVSLMIGGQRLTLKTDQDPSTLESMAKEVNDCIDAIRKSAPSTSAPQVMALALMQIMERARAAESRDVDRCHTIESHADRLEMLLAAMDSHDFLK